MSDETKSRDEVRAELKRIRSGIKITKITCSRSLKTSRGDTFVSLSASVQDDAGFSGAEQEGQTLRDAKRSHYMLALDTDLACLEQAAASGLISVEYLRDASAGIQRAYNSLIPQEFGLEQSHEPIE